VDLIYQQNAAVARQLSQQFQCCFSSCNSCWLHAETTLELFGSFADSALVSRDGNRTQHLEVRILFGSVTDTLAFAFYK